MLELEISHFVTGGLTCVGCFTIIISQASVWGFTHSVVEDIISAALKWGDAQETEATCRILLLRQYGGPCC